ncbi:MAG: tRNA (guanosine(37)-N1)-methyltransferase TrmD [Planctomycetes bacterium]|nr:tRNA (guanosine(37)-N1)-methyltransferase TrmD [Planctomycetota bacterium]
MRCAILTLFPAALRPYLDESILGIAQARGLLQVDLVDFRNHAYDPHRTVDDRPFGGGPGMVLKPEPIFDAVEDLERTHGSFHKILLCPRGRTFDQRRARALSTAERVLLLCGRYEGFDERIRLGASFEEISLGDFVLAGGELAALCVLEAAVRLIPGVLGCAESAALESFETELLDYPQYTRPREFRGMSVPDVLLSGDHAAVARWRTEQARILTAHKLLAAGPNPPAEPDQTAEPNQTTEQPSAPATPPRNEGTER